MEKNPQDRPEKRVAQAVIDDLVELLTKRGVDADSEIIGLAVAEAMGEHLEGWDDFAPEDFGKMKRFWEEILERKYSRNIARQAFLIITEMLK